MEKEIVKPNKNPYKPFQIRWKEKLGKKECPYLVRYVLNTPIGSIRLHKWIGSDDKRNFHDHPYSFITFVIKGSYIDVCENSKEELKRFSIRYRKAEHKHYVDIPKTGATTLLICGPAKRRWGYYVNGKLRSPMKYFSKFGHICPTWE